MAQSSESSMKLREKAEAVLRSLGSIPPEKEPPETKLSETNPPETNPPETNQAQLREEKKQMLLKRKGAPLPIELVMSLVRAVFGIISLSPRRVQNAWVSFRAQVAIRSALLDMDAEEMRVELHEVQAMQSEVRVGEGSLSPWDPEEDGS